MLKPLEKVHGLPIVNVEDDATIPFVALTKNLGRAEFGLCQRVWRGKIVELYIVPMQQENVKTAYLMKHHGATELLIGSFRSGEDPRVWRVGFCNSVKGPMAELYVQDGSSRLTVSKYSDSIDVRVT